MPVTPLWSKPELAQMPGNPIQAKVGQIKIDTRSTNALLAGPEPFPSNGQQIVLLHNSRYSLVVHCHSLCS